MHLGIIGAGSVGTGIAGRLAGRGHTMTLSFARDTARMKAAAESIGDVAQVGSPEEAIAAADVVVLATPWSLTLPLITGLAAGLSGKVLWDTTNPLKADLRGLEIGTITSGGEQVAAAAPSARVVKAIVPFAETLHSPSTRIAGIRQSVFVCGDEPEARRTVATLVSDLDAEPVEAGPLEVARCTEPLGLLLVRLAYEQSLGSHIGTLLLRDHDRRTDAA